jgi:hypothetical protein
MTPKEVLIAAKALIDTPEKWFGKNVSARPDSLCMIWAIYKVTPVVELEKAAIETIENVLPPSSPKDVATYNDSHTHKAVMRLMDRAIEAAS